MKVLKPTLKALEKLSYIHLTTIRSISDEGSFEQYCVRVLFQYELLLEAKKTADQVRSDQDIHYVVRLLKGWWVNFYVKQAA